LRERIVADVVLGALLAKLRAVEESGAGLLSETSVTAVDRLAIVLGTFREERLDEILETEERPEDVERVLELAQTYGLELSEAEVVVLARVRRFVEERLRLYGPELFAKKTLDVESGEERGRALKTHS